jgi:hypothetical protein
MVTEIAKDLTTTYHPGWMQAKFCDTDIKNKANFERDSGGIGVNPSPSWSPYISGRAYIVDNYTSKDKPVQINDNFISITVNYAHDELLSPR